MKKYPEKAVVLIENGTTPKNKAIVPIPDWGNKDLKIGTLRQIIRQLDLDWEEFKAM